MIDLLTGKFEQNENLEKVLWSDFTMFSVFVLLKIVIAKEKNPNETIESLIREWKNRVDSNFEVELKELKEKLGDKTDFTNILFGSIIPDIEEVKTKHKQSVNKIVSAIEAALVSTDC